MTYYQTYWTKQNSYIVNLSVLENRITFILMNLSSEDASEIFSIVLNNINRLKTKFTSITDLSQFIPTDSNVPVIINEIQGLLIKSDWGQYARVKSSSDYDKTLHGIMKDGFFNSFQSAEHFLNTWRKNESTESHREQVKE